MNDELAQARRRNSARHDRMRKLQSQLGNAIKWKKYYRRKLRQAQAELLRTRLLLSKIREDADHDIAHKRDESPWFEIMRRRL